ncbi:MAG: glycosyltransferase family 2 protein [Actinomycetota bacterium]|nr:glycosyltransferase family 2 protein [Actinomycetota bacterium]
MLDVRQTDAFEGTAGLPGIEVTYLLPLRWTEPGPIDDLASYLEQVAGWVDEILVIDGSGPELFAAHAERFGESVVHLAPDPDLAFRSGKVDGVVTGLRRCRNDLVVIADDDVRYEYGNLQRVVEGLGRAELVRPQNYFEPNVWHTRWDSARSLLNRVRTGDRELPTGDFPGTLAVRRSALDPVHPYDGDALFENLELMRTVMARGGKVDTPLDLYVARRPPSAAHFLSQRVRQAYDDFAMPARAALFLSLIPVSFLLSGGRRAGWLLTVSGAGWFLAEKGRRKSGGTRYFPLSATLFTPLWILERSICSWVALISFFRGGVSYGGRRMRLAAHSTEDLRRRSAGN